jgi:hypothetical protein
MFDRIANGFVKIHQAIEQQLIKSVNTKEHPIRECSILGIGCSLLGKGAK